MPRDRRTFRESVAMRIPLVGWLARRIAATAQQRRGRVPVGLLKLLPLAILLDVLDAGDEFLLGPLGMGVSFVLESAFLLGVTGRGSYAFGFAGIDFIPGVDVIPFATLTLLAETWRAWREGDSAAPGGPQGPVIDV